MRRSTRRFRFTDLPPELRLWIYRDLLDTRDTIIKIEHRTKRKEIHRLCTEHARPIDSTSSVGDKFRNVGILSVSKQLRNEAAAVLYSNHFGFESHAILNEFVKSIGGMCSYVKHISLALDAGWDLCPLRSMRLNIDRLTNLSVLRILPAMRTRNADSLDVDLDNIVANIGSGLRAIYKARLGRNESVDEVVGIAEIDGGLCPGCMGQLNGDADREECYILELGTTCDAVRLKCWEATLEMWRMLGAELTNSGK